MATQATEGRRTPETEIGPAANSVKNRLKCKDVVIRHGVAVQAVIVQSANGALRQPFLRRGQGAVRLTEPATSEGISDYRCNRNS